MKSFDFFAQEPYKALLGEAQLTTHGMQPSQPVSIFPVRTLPHTYLPPLLKQTGLCNSGHAQPFPHHHQGFHLPLIPKHIENASSFPSF